MANIFDRYDYLTEDEKNQQTPSQEAAQQQKSTNIFDKYDSQIQPEPKAQFTPSQIGQQVGQMAVQQLQPQQQQQEEQNWFSGLQEAADYFTTSIAPAYERAKAGLTTIPEVIAGEFNTIGIRNQLNTYEEIRNRTQKEIDSGKAEPITGLFGLEVVRGRDLTPQEIETKKKDIESLDKQIATLKPQVEQVKQTPINKYLIDTREQAYQTAAQLEKTNAAELEKKYGKATGIQWVANSVAANTPQFLTSFGLGITTGLVTKNPRLALGVGFTSSYTQEAGGAYSAAREAGLNDVAASKVAVNTGFASALIEQLPVANFLNKIPTGKALKQNVTKRVYDYLLERAKDGLLEGGTESIQTIIQNAFAQEYDKNQTLFEGVPESFLIGGILGGVGGAAGDLFIKEDGTTDEVSANSPVIDPEVVAVANTAVTDALNTAPEARTELQNEIVATFLPEQTIAKQQAVIVEQKAQETMVPEVKITPEIKTTIITAPQIIETPVLPTTVYRGTQEGGRTAGTDIFGKGLYTSSSELEAQKYGTVKTLSKDALPKNPLTFKSQNEFKSWLLQTGGKLGLTPTEFKNAFPDNSILVRALGYDGVVVQLKDGNYNFVKYTQTIPQPKPTVAPVTPVKTQEEITQENANIDQIKEGLMEGISVQSAKELYNSSNITQKSFNQIQQEVKDEQKRIEKEMEQEIIIQTAQQNRLLSDNDLNQYVGLLNRGIRYYNLNKEADVAKVSNVVTGFDGALNVLESAGYDVSTMKSVSQIYKDYIEARDIVKKNEKAINKQVKKELTQREKDFRDSLKKASQDRGIQRFRVVSSQSPESLAILAKKYDNFLAFYNDLSLENRQILRDEGIKSQLQWATWFAEATDKGLPEAQKLSKNLNYEQEAIDIYGTTYNPLRAAFITSEGQLIDGGGYPEDTGRSIDHREIAGSVVERKAGDTNTDALIRYMNETGNIRINVTKDTVYVDTTYYPTENQLNAIKDLSINKETVSDISTLTGNVQVSGEFTNYRDFIKWLKGNTQLQTLNDVTKDTKEIPADLSNEVMFDVPFTEDVVNAYYPDLVNIASETNRDAKINDILNRFDRLMIDATNPKVSNDQLHKEALYLVSEYAAWRNKFFRTAPEVNDLKFRINDSNDSLITNYENERLTTVFLQMPEIKNSEPTKLLSKGFINNVVKKARGSGMTDPEFQVIQNLLNTTFKDEDKISVLDLQTNIKNSLLGLEVYDSGKWANYGTERIGLNRPNTVNNTYIFNSDFDHQYTYHHQNFWNELITNKTSSNVYNPTPTIMGEFGHVRTTDVANKESYVLEIQADPFQQGVGVYAPITKMRRNISKLKEKLAEDYYPFLKLYSNNVFDEGSYDYNYYNQQVADLTDKIDVAERMIEDETKAIREYKLDVPDTKEEQMFQTYNGIWHERLIKEIIFKKLYQENKDSIKFPTPRTAAYIQGFGGLTIDEEGGGGMPYQVRSAGNLLNLVSGDTVVLDEEEYMVLSYDEDTIQISPTRYVEVFSDYQERMGRADKEWFKEITYYLDRLKENNVPLETVGDIKNVLKYSELLKQAKRFENKDVSLNNLKYSQYAQAVRDIETTDKNIQALEFSYKAIKNTDILNRLDITAANITSDKVIALKKEIEKINKLPEGSVPINIGKYDISAFNNNEFTEEQFKTNITDRIQQSIKWNEEFKVKKVEEEKQYREDYNAELNEINSRTFPTEEEIKLLPQVLQENLTPDKAFASVTGIGSPAIYIDTAFTEFFTEQLADETSSKEFVADNYLDNWNKIYETIDMNYEDLYSSVGYRTNGDGDMTVYITNRPNFLNFGQPNTYEVFDSSSATGDNELRKLDPDTLNGFSEVQRSVINFYATKVTSFLKKTRSDLQIVTDSNGFQWYETKQLPKDLEGEYTAFRKVQDDMGKAGFKNTDKVTQKMIDLNKKYFGDTNIKVVQQILSNPQILGAYGKNMITIVGGQAKPEETFYHEAVHKYISIFTTLNEQAKLYTAASKKYNSTDIKYLEEQIAEDFIKFANSRKGFTGTIKTIFEFIFDRVGSYFKHTDAINSLYKELITPTAVRKKITKVVPKVEKPIGEGVIKVPRLAVGVEQAAVAASIVTEIEKLPEYQQMNVKDQGTLAVNFLAENPEEAIAVALGKANPPTGIIPESVFIAVENQAIAEGNAELITQLATSPRVSEATALGQRIRMLGERNADSPVARITEIIDARKAAIEKNKVINLNTETAKLKESINKEVGKIKKGDWESFINSIQC
jgi:hypothetical protein